MPKSSWNPTEEMKASTDFETFFGRKEYASSTSGGYYATRLPILEYLENQKRQASVLAIRLETPSYWAGLGVWVVRESVRRAMNKKIFFASRTELIDGAKKIGQIKFSFDISEVLKKSKLLNDVLTQKKIMEWL